MIPNYRLCALPRRVRVRARLSSPRLMCGAYFALTMAGDVGGGGATNRARRPSPVHAAAWRRLVGEARRLRGAAASSLHPHRASLTIHLGDDGACAATARTTAAAWLSSLSHTRRKRASLAVLEPRTPCVTNLLSPRVFLERVCVLYLRWWLRAI